MDLLARYIVMLTAAAVEDASPIVIALICAWGKHRSRWLAERLRRWLEQLGDLAFAFQAVHLSDRSRMLEERRADHMQMDGYSRRRARQSAKHMGLRRERGEFGNIKRDLYRMMQAAGFGQHWADVLEHPPSPAPLRWCVQLLLFRA